MMRHPNLCRDLSPAPHKSNSGLRHSYSNISIFLGMIPPSHPHIQSVLPCRSPTIPVPPGKTDALATSSGRSSVRAGATRQGCNISNSPTVFFQSLEVACEEDCSYHWTPFSNLTALTARCSRATQRQRAAMIPLQSSVAWQHLWWIWWTTSAEFEVVLHALETSDMCFPLSIY